MEDFISNYQKYIDIATNLIFVVLSFLLFFKTKNTKYLVEVIEKMKVANNDEKKVIQDISKGQSFDKVIPIYKLNKATNCLELTDDFIDVQKLINSSRDTALDRILDRFIPTQSEVDMIQDEVDLMQDDLDSLSEIIELSNSYKVKFGLDPKLSVDEVFKVVGEKSKELKVKIDDYSKVVKDNEKNKTLQVEEKSE